MCVKMDEEPPLSMNQCPDGLRSLIGWLVDAALAMDEVVAQQPILRLNSHRRYLRAIIQRHELAGAFTQNSQSDLEAARMDLAKLPDDGVDADDDDKGPELPRDYKDYTDVRPVILLDEIETHLHPGWKRQVLPAFQRMFPKAQIIVATHSPFVISSVNYGSVHLLRRGEDGVVAVTHELSKGDSYMEAVQDILGVKERFDPATEELLEAYRGVRQAVVAGNWERLEEVKEKAQAIGDRGPTLKHMMTQELWQLDHMKPQAVPA